MKDNLTARTARIGIYDETLPGDHNKMAPCREGFLSVGIPALVNCIDAEDEWVYIDEIGYLESGCREYLALLRELMLKKRVAAILRKQSLPFLQELCRCEDAFLVDLDHPYGNMGCVIMASGLGTRFGGNKLMADFRGAPLICRALDATEGIFSRRVVVTRHKDIAALCANRNIDVVFHDLPHRSDTVRLGLEAVGDVDGCIFCPGDQPLLRRETTAALALAAANDQDIILRTAYQAQVGAPVLFPKWTFPELLTLPEGKGGSFVVQKYPQYLRTIPVSDMHELDDVDMPADCAMLANR